MIFVFLEKVDLEFKLFESILLLYLKKKKKYFKIQKYFKKEF